MNKEATSCPICHAGGPKMTGRAHLDEGVNYTQYHCDACGVEYWSPLKNPGADWYANHFRYGARNADPVWSATKNHKKTLSLLAEHRGSVLDVGCGIGNFLELAQRRGWQCAGIDIDPDAIESARKKTGIVDLEVSDVVEYAARHPEKKFDLITFFDVLEHVDNHNEFLVSIKKLLKLGGHIAMSMPYRGHALWLMKGDVPPCHLTCWDRGSLKGFLERHGFDVVYIRRRPAEYWSLVMKMRFRYGSNLSFNAVGKVRSSIGDTVSKPGKRPLVVRLVHTIAKMKDFVLFGIPAAIAYVAMMPSPKRYDDLFCIARVRN